MRTIRNVILGLTALGTASAGTLYQATGYNAFVFGNMTYSNTDIGGSLAVGGSANLSNFSVDSGDNGVQGTQPTPNALRDDLIVGGNLTYTNGSIFQGSGIYAGTGNISGVGLPVSGATLTQAASPINFSSAYTNLSAESAALQALSANGTKSNSYGTLTLTGTSATQNVFQLSAADVSAITAGINILVPNGSTVIIDVTGTNISFGSYGLTINGSTAGSSGQDTIWNFSNATSVSIGSTAWLGTVLAPNATFSAGANVNGQVIVNTLSGSGEIHNFLFQGNLPGTSTPEPAPILLTGCGLALVAARSLRGKRGEAR